MNPTKQRPKWLDFLLIFLIPIAGMALGVAFTVLLGIGQADYSNLVINLFFLAACVGLFRAFKFSWGDVGLQVIPGQMRWHVIISLIVFAFYMLFYIFAIRISSLKPFSASTAWGLVTYLVVIVAEELYFRGMLYSFFEKRFSARAALIVSSLLFGIFHARQGLSGIVSKTITGWLWGSVRYSSGMIFLLIFPIHFAYNSIWLLFEGNWSNPPTWGIYGLPALEILLGFAIVMIRKRHHAAQ